ncbi:glycosyl-4,4'-diaponeurosporenoate acyltransferase [Sporosarcina sp. PTS2304]|uniref:glycosyl-4,4'-diaponeurosporenoate acyltransferase CrtO family protein n=1 Tax=Sporosarcina sp. PTS2304 TaxID=2283194 RepID=UPI000E0D6EC4|nr:glycosyl-4,4'-diaponeurosporenoate acyltransferase [Sporosarcina sp. PTS2304]AXI00618.1 glycosyl-4,4'-diaponeurosporenoate acyltransferase [Sporosarcina sp. PTS2304]
MPLIDLPLFWLIIVDAMAWMVLHLSISFAAQRIPIDWFVRNKRWFRSFSWEKEGRIWQQLFRVKRWKGYIPDGTLFISNGYNKSKLHGADSMSLYDFLLESRRAEWVHWLTIFPSILFFLWNPIWAAWLNVVYAILFNVPLIVVQRFNRPRLERLLKTSR